MDILTHLFVSYAIGMRFKDDEHAFFFTLGGILPDFDILLYPIYFLNPYLFMFKHRTIFHSPFIVWLWAIIWFLIFSAWIRAKLSMRAFCLVLIGAYFHLLLDFFTASAIPLYPVQAWVRIPIFNSDSVLILVMDAVLVFSFIFKLGDKIIPHVIRLSFKNVLSNVFSGNAKRNLDRFLTLYLIGFNAVLILHSTQYIALQRIANNFPGRTVVIEPKLLDFLRWVIIKDNGSHYLVWHYDTFQGITREEVFRKVIVINGSLEDAYTAINKSKSLPGIMEILYSQKPYIIIAKRINSNAWVLTWINLERLVCIENPFLRKLMRYETVVVINL